MNNYNASSPGPDFLTDNIPQLIRQLAVPVSVGFFFNTMYNVVDTWFAGFLSTEALAALTLSFPIFFSIIAIGSGVSTAATAILSNELGKKNVASAAHFTAQSISFAAVASVALTLIGWLTLEPALQLVTRDEAVISLATQYLRVIFLGVPFFIFQSTFNAVLTAVGDTRSFRNVLIGGFFLNLGLDPLFLFGVPVLGIPGMGVAGIALATVLIQAAGAVYLLFRARGAGCFLHVVATSFVPVPAMQNDIAKQAIPAGIGMMFIAVGIFIITGNVSHFGTTASLAAYGVAMRIEQIALLPTIGLGTAVLAITGQNAGAQQFERVRQTFYTALKYGVVIMVVMLSIIVPFAASLAGLFDDDPQVIQTAVTYLRIEVVTFYGYILVFVSTSLLQGLKKPMVAVWLGMYRQLLAPLAIFPLFAHVWGMGVTGIWWGISVITWSAALAVFFYAQRTLQRISTIPKSALST